MLCWIKATALCTLKTQILSKYIFLPCMFWTRGFLPYQTTELWELMHKEHFIILPYYKPLFKFFSAVQIHKRSLLFDIGTQVCWILFSNFKSILFKIEYLTCLLVKINVSLRRHKEGRQYNFQWDRVEFRAQRKK